MKLTLQDLQKLTGLSTGNLSELENDKFMPSSKALISLSKSLNVSIDWLLLGVKIDYKSKNDFDNYDSSSLTPQEDEMLNLYRKLDDNDRQHVFNCTRRFSKKV